MNSQILATWADAIPDSWIWIGLALAILTIIGFVWIVIRYLR